MGCDIHLYVEKRGVLGWEKQYGFVSDYFDPTNEYFSGKDFRDTDEPYQSRNYTVFAAPANVRNGYGFAGIDTGDPLIPIAEPRGLPDDVSSAIQETADAFGDDGHSHSYLTLAELRDYNWDKPLTSRGCVQLSDFKKLRPGEPPKEWRGGVFGGNTRTISIAEAETYKPKPGQEVYVNYQWVTPLRDCCSGFLNHMLPILEKLSDGDAESVRIVFWFDN